MRRLILLCSLLLTLGTVPAVAQYNEFAVPDKYLEYLPIAADLALPLTGVEAKNPFIDRFLALGMGYASEVVMVQGLKHIVREERPDGESFDSFPSGHCATAFLGAECIRHEYGWGWGAGAYAVATSVAVLRVCHHRHYWWDTVAGAGAGVLCANIGYWLLDPAKDILGIRTKSDLNLTMVPVVDPFSGALCTSLSMTF